MADSRIVHVMIFAPSLGGGGAEMHCVRLANSLDRAGFRASVAVIRGGGSFRTMLADDVPVHVLTDGRSRSSMVRLVQAVAPLRALLVRERPDVVFSVMDNLNVVAYAAGRIAGIPVVASVQNSLTRYQREKNPALRLIRSALPYVYRRVARVIAISAGVAAEVVEAVGRDVAPTVIYNAGWDEHVTTGAQAPIDEPVPAAGRQLVLACGRLSEQKGYRFLLRAMRDVVKDVDAELWILGDGPLRHELEEEATRLELTERVRFLGFRDNPYRFMAAADVFVLSSLWEGFANVIVEAMACGAPVVATDCPHGPAEIIVDGESGLLVPSGDADAIGRAIRRVLTDAGLRSSLATNGRRRARDFGAIASARAHERVFEEVAKRGAGSAV